MNVVIVVGKKLSCKTNTFLYDAVAIRNFMLKRIGCRDDEITIVSAGSFLRASCLWYVVANLIQHQKNDTPLLLWYRGHGSKYGWATHQFGRISYRIVVRAIQQCSFPFLVINDCCNSGSLIIMSEKASLNPDQVGIITACNDKETSFQGMVGEILQSWKQYCSYDPALYNKHTTDPSADYVEETPHHRQRWGAVLDYHFFPKPTNI